MPGIGIITNPHSRRNRRFPEQMRRMGYVLGRHDTVEMTNRIEDVDAVARQFLDNDIDVLALNGGDGTNHVTLTRFIKVWGERPLPKIALLRGGTMNTVSNGVGIRGTPPRLLANLVEKYYTGQPFETTERDMLQVTDETGRRYGFIFGNGVIANFLEIYYDHPNPSPAWAARLLSKGLAQTVTGGEVQRRLFRPFRAEITADEGWRWPEQDYQAVLASTQEQIGLGFRPFIRCEERAGAFHILGAHGRAASIAAALPRMRLGLPVSRDVFLSEVSSRVVFRSDGHLTYTGRGRASRSS